MGQDDCASFLSARVGKGSESLTQRLSTELDKSTFARSLGLPSSRLAGREPSAESRQIGRPRSLEGEPSSRLAERNVTDRSELDSIAFIGWVCLAPGLLIANMATRLELDHDTINVLLAAWTCLPRHLLQLIRLTSLHFDSVDCNL